MSWVLISILSASSSEMLQFVSNQVGDFPDLFEDQMTSAGSLQSGTPHAALQTPQTPAAVPYQSSNMTLTPSHVLSPQSLPLTPPLTPAQTPSSAPVASPVQQQVTRSPPLLQPRPQVVQPIQPQQTVQPTIQVSEVR